MSSLGTLEWVLLIMALVAIEASAQATDIMGQPKAPALARLPLRFRRQDATGIQQPPIMTPPGEEVPPVKQGPMDTLYPPLQPPGVFMPPQFHPSQTIATHQAPTIFPPAPIAPVAPPSGPYQVQPLGPNYPFGPQQQPPQNTIVNRLGRRFMTLFNIGAIGNRTHPMGNATNDQLQQQQQQLTPEQQAALRNVTLVSQLNKGMHSVFSNLSKMWNSTVQQQLAALAERMNQTSSVPLLPDGTPDPQYHPTFQQRMSKQLPEIFQSMIVRVQDAQESLNRLWRQVTNSTANVTELESQLRAQKLQRQMGTNSVTNNPATNTGFFSSSDFGFGPSSVDPTTSVGSFYRQIQRSLGFDDGLGKNDPMMMQMQTPSGQVSNQDGQQQQQKPATSAAALMNEFWYTQVNPQMQKIQSKLSNVWRDLTTTRAFTDARPTFGGAFPGGPMTGGGAAPLAGAASARRESSASAPAPQASSNAIDQLLASIDVNNNPEYALVDSSDSISAGGNQANGTNGNKLDPQSQQMSTRIQAHVINMQRQLNGLWQGLTNSLQNALANAGKQESSPDATMLQMRGPQSSEPLLVGASARQLERESSNSSSTKELEEKIQEIERLQRDANSMFQVIQEQQTREPSIGQRFKGFFNNIHVPESLSRFGHDVNDFWNHIPNQWERFVASQRQYVQQMARKSTTTPAPSSSGDAPSSIATTPAAASISSGSTSTVPIAAGAPSVTPTEGSSIIISGGNNNQSPHESVNA